MINPTFGPALGIQDSVAIAASPNGYFAVWQDSRGTNGMDIFGCRISPTGQVLDVMSIPICAMPGDQVTPAVTWDGQRYLVVWQDRRDSLYHIYCCRVSASGEVLDPQGILVSGTVGSQSYPRVAGDGAGALVVWQEQRGTSPDIYCRKISSDALLGTPYGVSTRADNEEMPDVAFNGSVFFVVWQDSRNSSTTGTDIYGIRVSRTGVRSGSEILVSCTTSNTVGVTGTQRYPRVCAFGSSWMATWEDLRNSATTDADIYATRISSTGSILDRNGIAVSTASGTQESPAIGYNGSKILVSWRNGADKKIRGARVNTSGGVIDTTGIPISSGAAGSSGCGLVGFNGTFMISWSSLSAIASDCIFTPVSDGGIAQVPNGIVASLGLNSQQDYAVVDTGSEYAVVWSQIEGGIRRIMGARVSRNGTLLTPSPVNLTAGFAGDQTQPAIAWNGSRYLLVWRGSETFSATDADIRGRFLDASLTPIGTTATNICISSEEQSRPTVASNGTNFFVAWQDKRNAVSPHYYNDLWSAMVSSTGTVTPMASALSAAANNQFFPRAASDGNGYMVVWEDYRSGSPAIRAARVSSTGQLLDSTGIALPATSSSQTAPSICFGNGSYFITWSDYSKITGCRLSSTGSILDPAGITINSGTKRKQSPSACWDGQKYYVVWEDYRSSDYFNSDLYGTTVSAAGAVASSPETAIASDLLPQSRPCVLIKSGKGALFFSTFYNYADSARFVTLEDTAVRELGSIVEAKWLPVGSLVLLRGKVVSAAFPGFFYLQEVDRSSGIKVVSGSSVAVGNLVDVVGSISIVDGERQINASEITAMGVAGDGVLKPLAIRGDYLGGGPLNSQTPGITGAVGLNNIGLLATTWGKVVSTAGSHFVIEVKPGVMVRVKSGSLQRPTVGKTVIVTGVSTCEIVSGASCRAIMPRTQADIRVTN